MSELQIPAQFKRTLAVDIGNSRISCALFMDDALVETYNYATGEPHVAGAHLKSLSTKHDGALLSVSSVVPSATSQLITYWLPPTENLFFITAKEQTMISGLYETIGTDRIANCAAALRYHMEGREAAVVLDFGTATTLTAVGADGSFLGGMITLGLSKTFTSLHKQTAQLPELSVLEWDNQASPLAFDTARAIERGCVIGHIGMVKYWIERAKENLPANCAFIATGGLAPLIAPASQVFDSVDATLTLRGIKVVAEEAMGRADRG